MIRNILIINKNLVSIELVDREDLENFIKIFTVLDKHKAASTLFTEEVNIEYQHHDKMEIIELHKASGFTYSDIENILHHLSKHGVEITDDLTADALASAYNNAHESKDIAFSLFDNLPQFNIRINKNIFVITPMYKEHLQLSSKKSLALIQLLKSKKNTYDSIIQKEERLIHIVVHCEIQHAIDSIIKALIESSLLTKVDEQTFKERLRELAFKDQAFVEYFSIKTINRSSPLRKYESLTKDIESILCDFIAREDRESTIEKLIKLNLEITPDTPRIITKTIDRLVKFH